MDQAENKHFILANWKHAWLAMGMYMKNGEKDGAMVWVGGDNGDTVFALMRGTQ